MGSDHIQNWALGALVGMSGETKSGVARRAELTPQALGDFISGRRAGKAMDVRVRIAGALGVDVRAITCWCDDRQGNHMGDGL